MKKAFSLKLIAALLFQVIFISPLIVSAQKGAGNLSIDRLPGNEKRWALIIGVDTYQKDISPLYGTVNDAKALREALIKHAGFSDEQIILMTTDSSDPDLIPTRGNIIDQLSKLQRVVPQGGLVLFSFSGHGVSIGDDAFIVPSDGRIYQDAELMRERSIDVLRIKRAIQNTPAKQVIMFLDACRNDPLRAKGDVDNNLTTAYAKGFSFETKNQNIEAYATLYATSFGDRAYEFLDKKTNKYRGYFSYAIEEGLKGSAANDKGEVTLAGLIRYIEDTVKERVRINLNERQIPYPTTEGFRNSDLVIAVANKSESLKPPIIAVNQTTNPTSENKMQLSAQSRSLLTRWEKLLKKMDTPEVVISEATEEIQKNPNNALAHRMRLMALEGNLDEASVANKKTDSEAVLRLLTNPASAEEYEASCAAKNVLRKFDEALADCKRAIELRPNYALAYYSRASAYYGKQDYNSFGNDLNLAIVFEPDFLLAYSTRGAIYLLAKAYDQSIKDFSEILKFRPNDFKSYHLRGLANAMKQDYKAALEDFSEAIKLSPNNPVYYTSRAEMYEKLGRKDSAADDRRKALKLSGK